jgi:hypothetical protein
MARHQKAVRGAASSPGIKPDELADIAQMEADFAVKLWERNYGEAAALLEHGASAIQSASSGYAGWYLLWEGYALQLLGEHEGATKLYHRACRSSSNIPWYPVKSETGREVVHPQIRDAAQQLQGYPDLLDEFDKDLRPLAGGCSTNQTERAIRELGSYLGLVARRPDNDEGTGPDGLWHLTGDVAWSLELKTGSRATKTAYPKKEVMQAKDHVDWVHDNAEVAQVVPMIVGPTIPGDAKANPSDDLRVVDLSWFKELSETLRAAIVDIQTQPSLLAVPTTDRVFRARGLMWEQLQESLPGVLLKSL